jgi:CheY-like chemotaxis protein
LIDIAVKNSERLINLVNDLLDMEKIEAGRMEFRFDVQDMTALVRQSLAINRAYASEHGVEFVLVEAPPEARVRGDADRLAQVMANLLSNAAKFSPEGGRVDISVTRVRTIVRVAVADRGAGIPTEFRDRIFDRFCQADSSDSRQKGGTGLGLSITKAIVERHEGRIGFDTETDVGTTFYFELPELDERLAGPGSATGGARVLVCEDDPDVAKLLAMMLEQRGFATDVAGSAEEAQNLLARRRYDAMTVDIALPGRDGISLIQELRARDETRDLATVVVSAKAN